MRYPSKHFGLAVGAAALFAVHGSDASAQQKTYTLGSLAEGTTPFLVNTAWATAVNKYVPGHRVKVSAVGAATRHSVLVYRGRMDFTMWAPVQYNLMYRQIGPFRKIKNGPEVVEKISSIMSYQIGLYHPVVYAASGIKEFKDIKGKKVFLGPPAGVATRNTTLIVEAMTGYKPGKDYQQVKMGWGPAQQAFQDRKFDVWITVTTPPSPAVQQLTFNNKIRLLALDPSKFSHPSWKRYIGQPGRTIKTIDPRIYGKNVLNKEPVLSTGAWVGLAVRSDMSADLVYKMTKAFWEHLDEWHGMSAQLKDTLTLQNAVEALTDPVHPGALRYYKEKGIQIKKPFKLTKADLRRGKGKKGGKK
jgi:hypothetical protein